MGNYIDYIKWLGNVDMKACPFNESDAVILCELSYLDMSGVMEQDNVMTLRECCSRLERNGKGLHVRMFCDGEQYTGFLKLAAQSERFGDLEMSGYTDIYSEGGDVQFSAVTFRIDEETDFIAYRGTDETITGWKEDFMMSFTRTEAQRLSLEYANEHIRPGRSVFIAGHSKGGNLALYAGAMLDDDKLGSVKHIYCLDGPGLCEDIADTGKIARIRNKTTCLVPEYSVVGKLFEPDIPDTRVVCSDGEGMMQHVLSSWQIKYGHPEYTAKNSARSVWLNGVIDRWIEQMPQEERRTFVDEVFGALAKDGNHTLNDITANGAFGLERTLMNMAQISDRVKFDALGIPMQMLYGDAAEEIRKADPLSWINRHGILKYAGMILFGALMLIAPENMEQILVIVLFAGAALFQSAVTFINLRDSGWNAEKEQPRIYICIALITALAAVIIKENALFVLGSMLFGTGFLVEAFRRGRAFKNTKGDTLLKVLAAAESAFSFIYGISYLIIPQSTLYAYTVSVGIVFIADGVIRLIKELVSAGKTVLR